MDQAEEDFAELQYLADQELAKQENLCQQAEQDEELQRAFSMQDAPEVVVERLRGMSTGPIFQIAGPLLPESVTSYWIVVQR